jgi:hypothetical protein
MAAGSANSPAPGHYAMALGHVDATSSKRYCTMDLNQLFLPGFSLKMPYLAKAGRKLLNSLNPGCKDGALG